MFELMKNGCYTFDDIDGDIHIIFSDTIARFFIDENPSVISTNKGLSLKKKYFVYFKYDGFKYDGFAIVTKDVFDELMPLVVERKGNKK